MPRSNKGSRVQVSSLPTLHSLIRSSLLGIVREISACPRKRRQTRPPRALLQLPMIIPKAV
jgi:hypothetical protein